MKGIKQHANALESKVEASAVIVQGLVVELTEGVTDLEEMVEYLDNSQRKNDLKIRGLKEGTEGRDFVGYLTEFLQDVSDMSVMWRLV